MPREKPYLGILSRDFTISSPCSSCLMTGVHSIEIRKGYCYGDIMAQFPSTKDRK